MNVTLTNVLKSYQKQVILSIDKVELKANTTYAIRGRNGTGKTTLLKLIAQLLPSDQGVIHYNNEKVNYELMKEMTYVSPNPYIFNTTVRNNLAFPQHIRKVKTCDTTIDDYLKYFELDHIKDQNARSCSSGEKMKIAIARGLIFNPKLLLLDEPTTNLDLESIEKLIKKLQDIKKQTTILFISHHLDFINQLSDYDIIIKEHKLEMSERHV